jgi:hypothetical protein
MSSGSAKKTRDELIALIPSDAKRIKVTDEMGAIRWRDISEGLDSILDSDEIMVHRGEPMTMKHSPGRRKKAQVQASMPAPVSQTAAQVKVAKTTYFKKDPLLKSISQSVDSEEVLHFAMMALAEESASLAFERSEAERKGKETSQLSIRRIGAIKAVVDSWLKRKDQLAGKTIDLNSPAFAKLFEFMVETFRESMIKGGVPADQAETIFVTLSERMSDETWDLEARNRMKGA